MIRMAESSVIASTTMGPLQGNVLREFLELFQSVFKNPCKLRTIISPSQPCMECDLMYETDQLRGPPWLTAMLAGSQVYYMLKFLHTVSLPSSLSLSLFTPLPNLNLSKRQAYSRFRLGNKFREGIFSNLLTGLFNCFMNIRESLPLSVPFIELRFSSLTPV